MRDSIKSAAPALVVPVLVIVLFRKVLRLWWMYDDPFQLRMLRDAGFGSLLMSKDFYGGASVFTPLLIASLKLDQLLFGIHAPGFYAHQLLSFALMLIAEYCLLRFWCRPIASLAAVIVTMTGAPLVQVVSFLMCRHYIEGALFAIVATIAFVMKLRRDTPEWISVVAYFLAACAKEIFLPLPLLLFVIPESAPRVRLRALRGHAIAAIVYAIWRIAAVGFDLGAYGVLGNPGERWRHVAELPWTVVRELAGSGGAAGWAAVAAVAACAIFLLVRRRATRWPIAAAFVLSFLPLIPLAAAIERRYAFALWLCATIAVAFVPRIGIAVAAISLLAFRVDWAKSYRDDLRMSDEARIVSMLRADDILLDPITLPTTMLELGHLTGAPGHAYYDESRFCDPSIRVGRVFAYGAARREVVETNRAAIDRACASTVAKPMRVEIRFDRDGALYWSLGPYTQGRWSFVIADGLVAYDVTPAGGFRRPGWDRFHLRARYIAPDGWRTYSPPIFIDSRIPLTVWRR